MCIQSYVLNKCSSASPYGVLENSWLKWDQVNKSTGPTYGTTSCTSGCKGDYTRGTANPPALSGGTGDATDCGCNG